MLEREARREKILSALNKESRLKSRAKTKMKMMMDSGMLKKVDIIVLIMKMIYFK